MSCCQLSICLRFPPVTSHVSRHPWLLWVLRIHCCAWQCHGLSRSCKTPPCFVGMAWIARTCRVPNGRGLTRWQDKLQGLDTLDMMMHWVSWTMTRQLMGFDWKPPKPPYFPHPNVKLMRPDFSEIPMEKVIRSTPITHWRSCRLRGFCNFHTLKFNNGKNYPQDSLKKVSNACKSWTFMESNFPDHIADCKTYDKCKVTLEIMVYTRNSWFFELYYAAGNSRML